MNSLLNLLTYLTVEELASLKTACVNRTIHFYDFRETLSMSPHTALDQLFLWTSISSYRWDDAWHSLYGGRNRQL